MGKIRRTSAQQQPVYPKLEAAFWGTRVFGPY